MRLIVALVALAALTQPARSPVLLTSDDLGDNYDAEEAAALAPSGGWLALYDQGRALRRSEVKSVDRTDAGPQRYALVTVPPGAEWAVRDVQGLAPGRVETSGGNIDLGPTTPRTEFTLGRRAYSLVLRTTDPAECDAHVVMTEAGVSQTLQPLGECDEPHFRIHWAGDLDRDGRLDLLVTFSRKYSYFPRQLLLSSRTASGGLVGVAAVYERFAQ